MWWRKTIGIVPTLGHGMVPTIFWSARAEGVQRTHTKHLDPDGCLVQQRYRTLRMCGKGSGRHKAEKTKNPGVAGGGNFGKKSCSGKSVFLTKAFLWVPLQMWHGEIKVGTFCSRKEPAGAKRRQSANVLYHRKVEAFTTPRTRASCAIEEFSRSTLGRQGEVEVTPTKVAPGSSTDSISYRRKGGKRM